MSSKAGTCDSRARHTKTVYARNPDFLRTFVWRPKLARWSRFGTDEQRDTIESGVVQLRDVSLAFGGDDSMMAGRWQA